MVFFSVQFRRFFTKCCKPKARKNVASVMNHHNAGNDKRIISGIKNSNSHTKKNTQLKLNLLPRLPCLKNRENKPLKSAMQETTQPFNTLFSHTTTSKSQQTTTNLEDLNSGDGREPPSLLSTNENRTPSVMVQHSQQAPTYTCDRQKNLRGNRRVIGSALKRLFLPFKTYYELEWPFDNSSMMWLQLDKQMSRGIERVHQLGFKNLDVCLDESLTKFINDLRLIDRKVENILIEILFISGGNGNCDDSRKDSVLQASSNDNKEAEITTTNVRLLRLRRVHWWTKNYNLARVYHV